MWVLDARYKAEKVWYSFIWEKTKENPDVIDYNINEEVTKDTSAELNANNDTTTGMASVIPWVNSPKLIADTSVIWIPEPNATIDEVMVEDTSDTVWAQRVLDFVRSGRTFSAAYRITSKSFQVVHLDYVSYTVWYIRFNRAWDSSAYLRIDFDTTTYQVTSITTTL